MEYTTKGFRRNLLASSVAAACGVMSLPSLAQQIEEEVVVRGIKTSLERSLDIKRSSTQILEAVTADDIGKMPDQNVAESLQRLPGIQIDRNGGEGAQVRIRGLDQNITLLNGEGFLTGLEYYQVGEARTEFANSLEGVPSELLGGVEVYKTPRAKLIEGAIGGTINLKTRRGLDLKEPLIAANIKVDRGEDSEDIQPSISAVFGNSWNNTFSAILSLVANNKTVHSDQVQTFSRGGWSVGEYQNVTSTTGTVQAVGDSIAYLRPGLTYVTDGETERERLGASLSLQWAASDAMEFSFDWFHSSLDQDRRTYSVKHDHGVAGGSLINATVLRNNQQVSTYLAPDSIIDQADFVRSVDGAPNIDRNGVIRSARYIAGGQGTETNSSRELMESTSDNVNLGFTFDQGGAWRMSANLNYASSDLESESAFADTQFGPYGVRGFNGLQDMQDGVPTTEYWDGGVVPNAVDNDSGVRVFDASYGGDVPRFAYLDTRPLTDPKYQFYKSHWAFGDRVDNDISAIRADFERDLNVGALKKFSFGARFSDENVDFVQGHYLADLSRNGAGFQPGPGAVWDGLINTTNGATGPALPAVRASVGYDLCGTGQPCDLDGDGDDDNQLYGPYYRFLDAAIGDKSGDYMIHNANTNTSVPLSELIYGTAFGRFYDSPLVMPWASAAQNPERLRRVDGFFPSGNYTDGVLFADADRMGNPRSWFQGIAGAAPVDFIKDPLQSWSAAQTTEAAYAELEISDDNIFDITVGVRVVRTEVEITSSAAAAATSRLWSTDDWNGAFRDANIQVDTQEYTDVLPSVNAIFNVTDDGKIRASFAQVIARPSLQSLGQGFSQDLTRDDTCNCFVFNGGNAGNPQLEPFRADQIDVFYEHYFGDLSFVSGGVFYKDVKSFIASRSELETHPDQSPDGVGTAGVSRPYNGDGGKVKGVEVSLQHAWQTGLGLAFNFTYSDSETNGESYTKSDLPLPGVSETAYNLVGFYENDSVSARLAYTWRDDYLSPTNTTTGIDNLANVLGTRSNAEQLSAWYDSYGQWDANVTWDVTDNLSLTAEAINITSEDQTRYLEFSNQFYSFDSQERRFVLGASFRF